jgi:Putative Flp pilus-assembly TadE/G-like
MEVAMKFNRQSGQALVTTAISLFVLGGFSGLAIDMGVLRYEKRIQQTAADAAALAGATNIGFGGIVAGGQNAAVANGYTDGSSNTLSSCTGTTAAIGTVCVQVTQGPTLAGDPHFGNTNYVEAYVSTVQPTYFMTLLNITQQTVTARAVATNVSGGGPGPGCLYTLGAPSSAIEGVNINGSATLNAPTCGVVDNGNYNTKGNALVVAASTFAVAGTNIVKGPGGTVTCTSTPDSCPTPNVAPSSDPEAGKLTPPCSPCTGGTAISISGNGGFTSAPGAVTYSNGTYYINPGTYTSISVTGVSSNTLVFNPGLYIVDSSAGMSIQGNGVFSGNGVTFYFTNSGTMNMTGTPTMQLTAPGPSGQYPGVLFYQDPLDTSGPSFGGTSGSYYDGLLYFPSAQITFYGTNNSTNVAMTIADSILLSGTPTVNLQGAVGMPTGVNLVTTATLVE